MQYLRLSKSDTPSSAEVARLDSLYSYEYALFRRGQAILGGDEVGRGALAGPVTVGVCSLPPSPQIEWLNDSKSLTKLRRTKVADALISLGVTYKVAHVSARTVDDVGIIGALRKAYLEAIGELSTDDFVVVLDGTPIGLCVDEQYVVKGDARVASIAAASVLAKVSRDQLMVELGEQYPEYSFESNKGYGSAAHINAIKEHGLSPVHRRSFCSNIMAPTLF